METATDKAARQTGAFLTIKEVAAQLGLSRQRVYELAVDEARIPYVRVGRSIRIPTSAWAAYLDAQHEAAMANMGAGREHG